MVKKSNRKSSVSPPNRVDFTNTQHLLTTKRSHSKCIQDVQVFTSLPPNVEGDIKFHLKIEISKINLLLEDTSKLTEPKSNSIKNKQISTNKQVCKQIINDSKANVVAQCLWWGEENSKGSIFRPKISINGISVANERKIQTTAKYVVRSGIRQFSAYLNDMKTLDIDLIDEKTMQLLGKVQIHEIGQLSCIDSIRGCFSAFDEFQVKTADVFVDIQLSQAKVGQIDFNEHATQSLNSSIDSNIAKSSPNKKKSHLQPTTPASLDNITNFNTKYNTFENEQMKRLGVEQLNLELAKLENNNEFTRANHLGKDKSKSRAISNLIERGEALKNEMIKSAATLGTQLPMSNKPIVQSNFMDSSQLNIPYEQSFILPQSTSNFNEFIDNDFSMLSGSMHDPEILSALVYNQLDPGIQAYSFTKSNSESFNEDLELKELLEPTSDVLLSKLNKKAGPLKPVVNHMSQDKTQQQLENIKKYLKSINSYDNQSLDNDIENYLQEKVSSQNNTRVSFELQSSDNETCASSTGSGSESTTCIDSLCPQRLALLNLIQIAKLKINKLSFTSNENSLVKIIERISLANTPEGQKQTKTSKQSKPPRAIKTNSSDLFFIEYHFPVVATSRDNCDGSLMATQAMRVMSKKARTEVTNDDTIPFEHQADYSVLFNSQSLENWWRSCIVFKIFCRSINTSSIGSSAPHLIGQARLSLKNVLKSKNFKLLKKLAVYDAFNDSHLSSDPSSRKRIGTLHVNIELTSDLNQFHADLVKLKKYEQNNFADSKKKHEHEKQQHRAQQSDSEKPKIQPEKRCLVNSQPNVIANNLKVSNLNNDFDFNLPINMYLVINEARGFDYASNIGSNSNAIYMICRLFWCKEKVKFEANSSWSLNLSFLLKPPLINNMKNNFMIIEAYYKTEQKDTLIGTIKLPLHEFYLKFRNHTETREFLTDSANFTQPMIGVNGWLNSCDPFTGNKSGEINVLLAMGSCDQILNLQKLLFDQKRIKVNNNDLNYHEDGIMNEKSLITRQIKSNDIMSAKSECILMNIGILRANRLESIIRSLAYKNGLGCLNLEESDVFVKFSLDFLNKPEDFKQTHGVSTRLNKHSPEFFDYFDINCPLISPYNSQNRRTVSLAEQLEHGSIKFEVWSRFVDPRDHTSLEALLGTCEVPLDTLLANRIGIRGWLPIQAPKSFENNVAGGLEIAIRFNKHDDYLKISDTARTIGWKSINDYSQTDEHMITKSKGSNTNKAPLFSESGLKFDRSVRCLIEIERAVHLPSTKSNTPPNAFVSFESAELIKTNVCPDRTSPRWDFQHEMDVNTEYFINQDKLFAFKVWHKEEGCKDKLLGSASIDLSPLVYGLSHISGWYNIMDDYNNCHGQIKLSFSPKESLIDFKQQAIEQKKTQCSLNSARARFMSGSCTSIQNSQLSSICQSSNPAHVNEEVDDIKSGLAKNLSELDNFNRMFKERLNMHKTDTIQKENDRCELNAPAENYQNKTDKGQSKKSPEKMMNMPKVTFDSVVQEYCEVFENIQECFVKCNRLVETTDAVTTNSATVGTVEVQEIEPAMNAPEINKEHGVYDSFWASSLRHESIEESVDNINGIETKEKTKENIVDYLPPICQNVNLNDTEFDQTFNLNVSYEIVPEEQRSTNGSQLFETYDVIELLGENTIDCNKLQEQEPEVEPEKTEIILSVADQRSDEIDENVNESLNEYYEPDFVEENDKEPENVTVLVPEQINRIDNEEEVKEVAATEETDNVDLINNNEQMDGENRSDESLKKIIEEITNTVPYITTTADPQIFQSEINVSDKFKILNSKIPNYFLPQKDMEKSMKELQNNYLEVNAKENNKCTRFVNTEKTTDIIKNHISTKKCNLDRIQKIFNS